MIEYFAAVLMLVLYGWTFYNLPIVVTGLRRAKKEVKPAGGQPVFDDLPFVSVVVPAKNEGAVIGRCLDSLVKLDYPKEKFEVLVVEDGSVDDTVLICSEFEKNYPGLVRLIKNPLSTGKPAALNYAFGFAKGDVVGVFDADNVPACDVLVKAVRCFDDESVGAVQGRQCCLNKEENMLTKFVSYENALWYESYLCGKDAMGLFVAITGSCYFVRRDVLEQVGCWDGACLSEDMELAANLTNHGYKVRYAHDICSWQENPASVGGFFSQRVRWFRGCMEVAVQYGKLMKKPSWIRLDAEITLMGSFIVASGLIGYLMALITNIVPVALDSFLVTAVSSFLITAALVLVGVGMVYVNKPHNFKSLFWLPFVYFYWMLQTFIAAFAFFKFVFRRPKKWIKTHKTGKQTETFAL